MERPSSERSAGDLRLGQAAELLGVSPETLRRWEADGRLATHRSAGGQRLVGLVALWLIYRIARGWLRLVDRRPMYA